MTDQIYTAITPDGVPLSIEVRGRKFNYWERRTSPKARFYFWHDGVSILDDFWARVAKVDRPYAYYRKALLPTIQAVVRYGDDKVRWSKFAGCSCPCSPGFIYDGSDLANTDVFVMIHSETDEADAS